MNLTKNIILVLTLALITTACGGDKEVSEPITTTAIPVTTAATTTKAVTTTTAVPTTTEAVVDLTGKAINPLTGLYIDETIVSRRPIGIMINNHRKAQPQSGLSQADIVYESLVEGGITRMLALFKDFDGDKIGPVRSARHYFVDFTFDFDALYVHYGQSPQAGAAVRDLNVPSLNAHTGRNTYYDLCYQDSSRSRPHNSYTSYDRLMAGWAAIGHREEIKEGLVNKLNFSETPFIPKGDMTAKKVTLDYSTYQTGWFDYDADSKQYLRSQFDAPQIDVETGEQLAFDNVIIQMVKVWNIPGDTAGRLDMETIGEGSGYYINQGVAVPITWKKTSHYDPTVYYGEDGKVLVMNVGKTFISLFPTYRPEGLIIE